MRLVIVEFQLARYSFRSPEQIAFYGKRSPCVFILVLNASNRLGRSEMTRPGKLGRRRLEISASCLRLSRSTSPLLDTPKASATCSHRQPAPGSAIRQL